MNKLIKLILLGGVLSVPTYTMDPDFAGKPPAAQNKAYRDLKTTFAPLNISSIRLDGTQFKASHKGGAEQSLSQCIADVLAAVPGNGAAPLVAGVQVPAPAAVIPADALRAIGITELKYDNGTLRAKFNGSAEQTLEQCTIDLVAATTTPADALVTVGLTDYKLVDNKPTVTRAKTGGGHEEVLLVHHIHQLQTAPALADAVGGALPANVAALMALTDAAKTKAFLIARAKQYIDSLPDGDIVDQDFLVKKSDLRTKEQISALFEAGLAILADDRFKFMNSPVNVLLFAEFVTLQKNLLSTDVGNIITQTMKGSDRLNKQFLKAPNSATVRGFRDNLLAAIFV